MSAIISKSPLGHMDGWGLSPLEAPYWKPFIAQADITLSVFIPEVLCM